MKMKESRKMIPSMSTYLQSEDQISAIKDAGFEEVISERESFQEWEEI